MNNLVKTIQQTIESTIDVYVNRIVSEFEGLEKEELLALWNECTNSTNPPPVKVERKRVETKTVEHVVENSEGCEYLYVRGAKANTKCGVGTRDGSNFCSKHKKYEGQSPKPKKVLPTSKRTLKPSKVNKSPVPKKIERIFRKHKQTGTIWHPETGLTIKSTNERVVNGKIINDKFIPHLNEDDITLCKQWSFAYEENEENKEEEKTKKEEMREEQEENKPTTVELFTDNKFWKAIVKDTTYTINYGTLGSKGTVKDKTFETHEKALKHMEKEKDKKLKKGYTYPNTESEDIFTVESADSKEESEPELDDKNSNLKQLDIIEMIQGLDSKKCVSQALGFQLKDETEEVLNSDSSDNEE